jgi:hypothetical protein
VQEAKHLGRIFQKVVLSHPFGAASKIVELCRMYDNNADLFLYYTASLLPVVQEIIMFEALRFLMCTNKSRFGGPDKASPDDWLNNTVRFVGRLVAQATHLDVYVIFAYLSQSLRSQEHPLDVILAGAVFENSLSAQPHCRLVLLSKSYPCHAFCPCQHIHVRNHSCREERCKRGHIQVPFRTNWITINALHSSSALSTARTS